MALLTLGTNANNSLTAFKVGVNDFIAADLGNFNNLIRNDQINGRPRLNQAYVKQGILFVPNRGQLRLNVGDYIALDATTGWPIVVSADAAANGPYTHT